MSNTSGPRLLTLQQFAQRIGISVPTARVWVRRRRVSTVRFGRPRKGCRIQIPASEVNRIIAEGSIPATPEVTK